MHRFPDRRSLQSLADGEVPGSEGERLRRHVVECSPCTEELRRMERLGALIQHGRPLAEEMSRAEAAEVFQAALTQSGVLRRRNSLLWRAAWSVAGMTAAVGACFVLMPRSRPIVPHQRPMRMQEGSVRERHASGNVYLKPPAQPLRALPRGTKSVRAATRAKPRLNGVVPAEPATRIASAWGREPRKVAARPRVERLPRIAAALREREAPAAPRPEVRVAFGRGTPAVAETRGASLAEETAILQERGLMYRYPPSDVEVLAKQGRSGQTLLASFKEPDVPLSVRVAGEETQGYARVSALRVSGSTVVRTECTVSSESPEPNVVITTVSKTNP
jgi:hypothetical protein